MDKQSHYREVPWWGVSNGVRHNWKCFLAYIKFEVFLFFFYVFDTSKCSTCIRIIFEEYGGFIGHKILKLCRQESWLKSQFLFHKNLPPRNFSIMTLWTRFCFSMLVDSEIREPNKYSVVVFYLKTSKPIYCFSNLF